MKYLNIIRKILVFPVALLLFPIIALVGFFMTDWSNQWERNFYFKVLKSLFN